MLREKKFIYCVYYNRVPNLSTAVSYVSISLMLKRILMLKLTSSSPSSIVPPPSSLLLPPRAIKNK